MKLLSLFTRKQAKALPPLVDETLGELRWEPDADGWMGAINCLGESVELYLGSGAPDRYPSEGARALIRPVAKHIESYAPRALEFLVRETRQMKAAPAAFVLSGLETYEHYAEEGICAFTFSDGLSETIWRVNWRGTEPDSVGLDD